MMDLRFYSIFFFFSLVYLANGFLMPDILNNRTSTVTSKPLTDYHPLTDRTVQDLLTIIADEKASRHQLESLVSVLESKLNQMTDKMYIMDQFHDAVTKELIKERNNSNKTETMYRGLQDKLENLTIKYNSLELYVKSSIGTRLNDSVILTNFTNSLQVMNDHYNNLFNKTMTDIKSLKDARNNGTTTGSSTPEIVFEAHHLKNSSPSVSETLIFQTTTLNLGSCYNDNTGKFTATHPGLYQFNTQICLNDDMYYWFKIMSSSGPLMETCLKDDVENTKVGCTSVSAFAVLSPGDRVWVQSGSMSTAKTLWATSEAWNSFSGALLHK